MWQWATIAFLTVTTLLRLTQLSSMELVPDEAYYWEWSRHLSPGYYDQGPMIAYVIRLTTALFGTNEFGVRFGVCAASLGTLICSYILARRLFSPLAGFLTVVLLGLTPIMAVGSLIATYDPLLVFFWTLALVALERALFGYSGVQVFRCSGVQEKPIPGNDVQSRVESSSPKPEYLNTQRPEHLKVWLFLGVATGLGFLSKHTMLLMLPCLLLFLALSPSHRFWLRRPEPYVAFALTLLLYSGVFWWNAHHHWWTFGHLLFLTHHTDFTPFRRLSDFIGSQALMLGPVLFVGCLAAGVQVFRCSGVQEKPIPGNDVQSRVESSSPKPEYLNTQRPEHLFLFCMGYPVLLFFCLLALRSKVQANWAPYAWITPTILWVGWLTERGMRTRRAMRRDISLLALACLTSGALTLLLIRPELRKFVEVRLEPGADVSNTAYGWRTLAARVQAMRREMQRGGHKVFIAGNGYQYIALMAFYLPDHPETHDLFMHFRLTMYAAYVQRLKSHLGEDAVFIDANEVNDADLRQIFTRVEWQPPLLLWRRPLYATPIAEIHLAKCYDYRRYTGLTWASGG